MKWVTALLILFFIAVSGCSQNVKESQSLKKDIRSEMNLHKSEFRLSHAADFSWEKAYIFGPYTTEDEIEKELGMPFKNESNLEQREDMNIIVFVKGNRVIMYAEIPRSYGDFLVRDLPITPKKDQIRFQEIKT
ncbi:hypothetical protein [Bacillus sp. SJS]|uniref:hypothetical protein n=1 Tax=Bacillus sp. SJS TaxID=1423321 RepID=UPI000690AA14|nr:hypothetical protein [Bacillus sp. SJS]KZZ83041.1 hypothetical protein AS29_019830 [Bacillus sp. SJS]